MQALEKIGVLEQDEEKGGRRITQSGRRDLDRELHFLKLHILRKGLRRTEIDGGGIREWREMRVFTH